LIRFLLDTNIISAILDSPESPAARRYDERVSNCFTSIIVAGELRFGIAKRPDRHSTRKAAELLEDLLVLPFESPADEHYGRLRAHLELGGTPIGANDMFIAAHALALDATLVTANEREFRRVPGLKVENWTA
jgi:tRNA(fMet)-specific endonuclease VapC